MMNSTLVEMERQISGLSPQEQLWLVERISHGLRRKNWAGPAVPVVDLAAMAADPAIQGELQKIDEEFSITEADGLENL